MAWIEQAVATLAPQWHLRRLRARLAAELVQRHYEGAAVGRRTQGWRSSAGDANAIHAGATLQRLRDAARDLVRNNCYAESALGAITDHTVGAGIQAKPNPTNDAVLAAWRRWAESKACDADGLRNFYGLQELVMAEVVEAGEVLVRRRWRRLEDGLPLPLQLQVLEADFLDTSKTQTLPSGAQVIQGVEFDLLGKRAAYWLFPQHPGSPIGGLSAASRRIPASEIQHIFRARRAGQVRGPSWFAPTLVKLKDFDEYDDATLMKQKVAALLAVVTSDPDGSAPPLGTADDTKTPPIDTLEPGAILNVAPGRTIEVVQPPNVSEHGSFSSVTLHAIAAGLGVTYEDLTGDYQRLPFSAARMSWLRHWAKVERWRWQMLIPQFCDPAWAWATEAMALVGLPAEGVGVDWTPPPVPMIEPDREGLAVQRNIRSGIQTPSGAIRERGLDPEEFWAEYKADLARLDELGIVLDSDPRRMTQSGQAQSTGA